MNAVSPSVFLRRLWRYRLLLVAVLVFHTTTVAVAGVEKTSEFVKGKSKCRFVSLYFYRFVRFPSPPCVPPQKELQRDINYPYPFYSVYNANTTRFVCVEFNIVSYYYVLHNIYSYTCIIYCCTVLHASYKPLSCRIRAPEFFHNVRTNRGDFD